MKTKLLFAFFLLFTYSISAQETIIPDSLFETFLEANGMGNGIANDNLVTTANIENRTTLNIRNLSISSLIGIEGFTNLVTLRAGGNSLKNIDLSGLTNLDYVTLEDNILESLNISNNPSLGSLIAFNNSLTSIDITGCVGLTELYLQDNMLTDLDLSLFPNLNAIDVSNNQLTTLNIKNGTNNSSLNYSSAINTTGNIDLECITVDDSAYSIMTWENIDTTTSFSEDCTATTNVPNAIFEDYLETHDANGNIVMIGDPTGMGNGIANDNLVKTPRIERVTTLDVSSLNIDDLTGIEGFAALETLSCYLNQLTKLELSNNVNLEVLQAGNNAITELDLKNNTALQTLNVDNNNITELNLSNNSLLIAMSAAGNDLRILDMKNGNNDNVTTFFSTGNSNLSCINVDNDSAGFLKPWTTDPTTSFEVGCNETNVPDTNFENYLETHNAVGGTVPVGDLTSMGNGTVGDGIVYTTRIKNVTSLSIDLKGIENLTGIESFMALETLSCPFNNIETVDLSSNLALTSLTATSSNIKFLNVTNNSNLTSLSVSNNDIEFLDLSNNSNLTYIGVSNNELTFLNNHNGNNGNVTGFVANGNSGLTCINVDDETASYLNNTSIWIKDVAANYGIHCDETDVPNDIFEYYLETHDADGNSVAIGDANSMGNGIDNDNRVNTIAINKVTRLDVSNLGIDNLTGIEGFVALTELYAYDNSFETIDLSNLSQLVKIFIHRGSLVALDVTANTLLEDLRADTNTIDQINLTNNPLLQILQLIENDIEEIDVTANTALTRFRIKDNPIKELDLSTNIALTELWINACDLSYLNVKNGNNGILVNFFASNNPSLRCINVDNATDATAGNGIYSTWVKDGTASYSIHCNETYILDANFENYLETHDAAGTIVPLGDPTSMGNGIANDTYVTTANINTVTSLDVNSSSITDLTGIEGFTALETLHCYSNNLDALDISANTALKTVICYSNNLDELVLSTNVNLITLVAHTNVITSLNADTCTVLETFIVSNNNLDTLSVANGNNGNMSFDATGNPNLDCINVDNDTASYLSNWGKDPTASFNEHCYETYIPDANFETFLEANGMGNNTPNDNYVLTSNISGVLTLDISNLSIASLTGIEAFTALETLFCYRNNLDELDLSENTALTDLECYNNQLDELDLSTNTNLEFLDANTNTIIEIDLELNTALKEINLDGNNLTVLNLDTCIALEKLTVDSNNLYELNIINGNNASITDFSATANPNLLCINVDDPTQGYLGSWILNEDGSTSFGEHCYETFVSDANFENYLETHDASGTEVAFGHKDSMGNGIVNDNYVYTTAINTVTSLNVSNQGIADLTGIANFTGLVSLDASNNELTSLDLTQNTNLETLDASNNALTQLNLKNGNNAAMTSSDSVIVTGNANLACINVDDPIQSYLEDWTKDPTASFGDHCYETYIHDALFENFLETRDASRNVVDLGSATSMGNGIANDHYVFTDRISEVTELNIGFLDIEDLTGIGGFTALEELKCNHNELKKLDVSENIALLKLTCQYNAITSLDLSANVNLAHLRANHNGLTDLDIGDNAVLDEIYLDGNSLVTLDVDTCVLLERLDINDNNLSTLSIVNGNNSILQLAAADNPNLTCINVDDPTQSYLQDWITDVDNPFSIYCFATVVTDLNFEAYLETHDANGIQVELGSDTSMGNGILEDGYVTTKNIEEVVNLDISNLTIENLTGLENFTALESLTCSSNTISILDVSNNTNLTTLIASSNTNLSTVNTTNLLALETLTLTNNSLLTSLDVTTNTALVSLDSNTNGLTTLDISQNTNLATLDVSNNGIAVLDISQNISLTTLDVSNNGIEVVDVTKHVGLTTLDVSSNGIDILDVTQNINLETLAISSNDLEIVDLTQNTGLTTLNISENGLTTLSLIKNTSLTTLNVASNQLTTLDLRNGNNVSIVSFDASSNPNLSCINVDDAAQGYLDSWNINVDGTTSFGEHCNETNVTDRNFERYLEKHDALGNVVSTGDVTSLGNGIADDGYVTTSRISSIVTLDVSNLGIKGLTGIQDFIGLETLTCSNNTISTLDLSQNIALLNLDCQSNGLKTLDISANVNLEKIQASFNNLGAIGLEQNTALKEIYLKDVGLSTLNLDASIALEILDVSNNSLITLSIKNGNNANITQFTATENPPLSCINVDDPSADYLTSIVSVWSKDDTTSFGDHCYEIHVIDANFENYLETHDANGTVVELGNENSMGNGIANDDYVLTSRISEVTTLSIGRLEIEDLTGIENFIALETLLCFGNKLKALDVSKNTALRELICYQNEISTLDLSTNVNLEIIEAGNNLLTTLDVHLNTALKQIFLYNNNLTKLIVDTCVLLEKLYVSGNSLTELRIVNGNNVSITNFDASNNPNLTCINVDDATQEYLADWLINDDDSTSFGKHCNETYIVDAIFENYLETHDANRDEVSLGDPTSMGNGIAGDNYVRTTSIEEVTYLNVFDLAIEDLTGIEDFTALTRLNCAKNKLTSLDVSQNGLLEDLSCYENQIKVIDLTNNTALIDVSFSDNLITTIDVTNNKALTSLVFSRNQITTIDLSQNIALEYFSAKENQFTSLDFSHNTLIEEIYCSENVLTSLVLSQCAVLEEVNCDDNQLSSLDLTTNIGLREFYASNNSFTSIDVSKNTNLEHLSLNDNQLMELDVSQNINLEEFQGENNVLTNLNVKNGNNTNIGLFWIRNNPSLTCVLVDDATYNFSFTKIDFQTRYNEVTCGIQASPKVFLQGAALNPNTDEEDLMRDDLRVAGMLPTRSPYEDGLLCNSTVFDVTGNDAIVDWIWVELRDDSDNTAVVASQSALLQRDGDVVATDGITALSFNQSSNDYYIAVKHRNHLAIITENTIDLSDTETTIDFTTDSTFTLGGTNALIDLGNGIFGMVSGDYDANGQIQNSDISSVIQQLGTSGYDKADMDMNGQIQNSDINNLLNPNIGKGEQF